MKFIHDPIFKYHRPIILRADFVNFINCDKLIVMSAKVKKAILPVAGKGTRVMPLTLHQPKAMIAIADKPMIHYVIDEMIVAGIKNIILVINPKQLEFKHYVDYLKADPEWRKLRVKINFAEQKTPRGNGDAVYVARDFVQKEPHIVGFSDDLLTDKKSPMSVLISFFYKTGLPIVVLEPVPKKLVSRYGIVAMRKTKFHPDLYEITDIIEKPEPKEAPSNLSVIGRYLLTPAILEFIKKLYPVTSLKKEIYLADALKLYLKNGGRLLGWRFRGTRFDCGSKLGLLKAQVHFGLKHQEFKHEFKKYLKKVRI